jgi:pimeloyl-ACP methyl ester carboxylesterase
LFILGPFDPLSAAESQYVRRVAGSEIVIVFVHGVMGDGESTWTNGTAYWPAMLASDDTFDGADIFTLSYPTSRWATLSVDELAEYMRLQLNSYGVVSDHKRIVFLAHSMGGVVTRAYLLKNRDAATKTSFLYFYSTPSEGSQVAALASFLSRNPQFGNLKPIDADSYLANLLRQWLDAQYNIPSYCAYEKLPTYGASIVTFQSASALCTKPVDPIDENHIDIVKPKDAKAVSYLAFKAAYRSEIRQLVDLGNIFVHMSLLYHCQFNDEFCVDYSKKIDDKGQQVISAESIYTSALATGHLSPVDLIYRPFDARPLDIRFRVLNNSSDSMLATDIKLKVKSSKVIHTPIPKLYLLRPWELVVINDGWGPLSRCQVKLSISSDTPTYYPCSHRDVSKIETDEVNIADSFKRSGLDMDEIIDLRDYARRVCGFPDGPCTYSAGAGTFPPIEKPQLFGEEYKKRRAAALGPFSSGIVKLVGELLYSFIDEAGQKVSRSIPFSTAVDLFEGYHSSGWDAPVVPEHRLPEYRPEAKLQVDATNYSEEIPIFSNYREGLVVKPRDEGTVDLTVGADKSSTHEVSILLSYNGREVLVGDYQLNMIVPRTIAPKSQQ